jgi:hypothetical protein
MYKGQEIVLITENPTKLMRQVGVVISRNKDITGIQNKSVIVITLDCKTVKKGLLIIKEKEV